MKHTIRLVLGAGLSLCLFHPVAEAAKPEVPLRIGSYNLRRSGIKEKNPQNSWAAREDRVALSFVQCNFDLCGLQEVDVEQQESLAGRLAGKNYAFSYNNPYNGNDPSGNKAHGVMWRKDRLKLVGRVHRFWISEPFDKKQVNDGKHIRGGLCATFKDRKTGRKLFIIVSHAPLKKEMRAKNAHVYIDVEKAFNPKGLPSFFVGDLNAREDDKSSEVYRTWWTDSYLYFDAKPELRTGLSATFNGWRTDKDPDPLRRIDYIYFRGNGITPLRYHCDTTRYEGFYPSDHFPIWADFTISRK